MANIVSRKSRALLAPRREPYWHRIREGCFLGYRALIEGDGTWVARYRDADGKQQYRALGTFTDGKASAFDQAAKASTEFFANCDAGIRADDETVWTACEQYARHLRAEQGDRKADAELARLRRLVRGERLARIELAALRPEHVREWRQSLMQRPARIDRTKGAEPVTRARAPATFNRDLVPLRAALNFALAQGQVATAFAWREALKPIRGADGRRDLYLTAAERALLIEHAGAEIAPFLRGLTLLPLRPGALAALRVAAFDRRLNVLRVGEDKAGKGRALALPPATAQFLAEQARDALPTAPLFRRANGEPWNKDSWKGPIKDAVAAAGLPLAVSAYTLRHSTITDLVTGGLDLLTIAQISGTSVAMIERHYGHLRKEHAAAALATLAAGLPA